MYQLTQFASTFLSFGICYFLYCFIRLSQAEKTANERIINQLITTQFDIKFQDIPGPFSAKFQDVLRRLLN